jgi:transcription initiation factor IIF auxiliary subunit
MVKMARFAFLLTATIAALALEAPAQSGSMGVKPMSEEEFAKIPRWTPAAQGVSEAPEVDLRFAMRGGRLVRVMPEVGRQYGNSCVGWAVAYAAKSYQESLDQEWVPDGPGRQFSPSFIYNQINGGADLGSSPVAALRLVERIGCATMATMPYSRDFRAKPTRQAFEEAKAFRSSGFSALDSEAAIRKALQQGHVVLVSVQTNSLFNTSRWDVYTPALHALGEARRVPNAPHALHLLCFVGYDDVRSAFLVMNSWGTRWHSWDRSYPGMAWVHYDLMRTVRPTTAHFAQTAFLMHDIRHKVRRSPGPRPADRSAIGTGSGFRYNGFRNGAHTWQWTLYLTGPAVALAEVTAVDWLVPTGGGRTGTWRRTDASNNFALHGNHTGPGRVTIGGVVHFRDGATVRVSRAMAFAAPTSRSLTLDQSDFYWGRKGNEPTWEWTVFVRGSLTDLADVKHVTYHLHPTFRPPDRVATSSAATGFAYTTRGWGAFKVKATVLFKDGTTQALAIDLAFKSPIRDELRLSNTSRPTGRTKFGKDWWDWCLFIEGPLKDLRQVAGVRYLLHPTFNPSAVDVTDRAAFGFPLSRSGWGTFEARAQVKMRDGTARILAHMIEFKW